MALPWALRASASRGPKKPLSTPDAAAAAGWLIIFNLLALSSESDPLIIGAAMRSVPAILACAFLPFAAAASAETKVFIVASHADGYGVDQCLAKGEKCGAYAARSYCQTRDFALAVSYRRVDPEEITGSVPKDAANCPRRRCDEYVAITCQR